MTGILAQRTYLDSFPRCFRTIYDNVMRDYKTIDEGHEVVALLVGNFYFVVNINQCSVKASFDEVLQGAVYFTLDIQADQK